MVFQHYFNEEQHRAQRFYVDQWLALMSAQEALGATLILHVNFDLQNYYILGQEYF